MRSWRWRRSGWNCSPRAPAKEASVPNLVAPGELPAANALSLAAAYGTFPFGALAFAALAPLGRWVSTNVPEWLPAGPEGLALWVDAALFAFAAWLLRPLRLPSPARREPRPGRTRAGGGVRCRLRGGALPREVRAVFVGLAVGLLAAGSLIPLGPVYLRNVLNAGDGTFGLLTAGLGFGVAVAVIV